MLTFHLIKPSSDVHDVDPVDIGGVFPEETTGPWAETFQQRIKVSNQNP